MEVLRYVLPHLAAGCLAGVVAAVGVVASNLGSLRDLVLTTEGGWLAFALLVFGFVVTFGSAAIGGAIMSLADNDE
jgi:type IV secretory pathway VirB2 component (pilin)